MRRRIPVPLCSGNLAACLLLAGCDPGVSSPEPVTEKAGTPGADVARRLHVADGSLPSDRYISLGLSAHDREWMGTDLMAAATALQALATTHPEQLPRFQSAKSGSVFARLVARENLNSYRARSVPLEARLPVAIQHLESTNAIFKLYFSAFLAKKVEDAEIIELYGALLCIRLARSRWSWLRNSCRPFRRMIRSTRCAWKASSGCGEACRAWLLEC
jgi:hypothetical protein